MTFEQFFTTATGGNQPYDYQRRLAEDSTCESKLIEIPTGLGKTAAVVLAWLWNVVVQPGTNPRKKWPRRLVYCLPMRTLVEQTHGVTKEWLRRLAAELPENEHLQWLAENSPIILMGGEEKTDWDLYPEREAILIGTQDMLLSRALNRGYGMSRYRWPMHFGLLNNDALWVMDETQIMGSGLATTVQLDAFRQKLWTPQFACPCWWMSATVGEAIFETRDRTDFAVAAPDQFVLLPAERAEPAIAQRLNADKAVQVLKARPQAASRDGSGILDRHFQTPGRISLVIVNTAEAARGIFHEIETELPKRFRNQPEPVCLLLHSRFRPLEREKIMDVLQRFIESRDKVTGAVSDHPGLILVSTQVVEAGMDISADTLWSEIALWSSIIQRLGRLNREGSQPHATAFFWMPKSEDAGNKKGSPNAGRLGPYDKAALQVAEKLVRELAAQQSAGLPYRAALEAVMATDASKKVMHVEPEAVIRPDDLFGLFSTEPDLAGGFTDVSPFVRDQDRNADAQVYWRDVPKGEVPSKDEPDPRRQEMCAVPFHELRLFLDRTKGAAWEWDSETGQWQRRRAAEIFPGMTLLLSRAQGGYSAAAGWTGHAGDEPPHIEVRPAERAWLETDLASESDWLPLADHTADVQAQLDDILKELGITETPEGVALRAAARWHDVGKAHPRWQTAVHSYVARALEKLEQLAAASTLNPKFAPILDRLCEALKRERPERTLWGKFPDLRPAWNDQSLSEDEVAELKRQLATAFVPNLRHEAASALAAWKHWLGGNDELTALACYLIATHHGKVRTILRASSRAKGEVFGIREGEKLPALPGYFDAPLPLDCALRLLGSAGEWDEGTNTFTPAAPSWVAVIGELLGSALPSDTQPTTSVPTTEPRGLGPFRLAYLEALLAAADVRGSKSGA